MLSPKEPDIEHCSLKILIPASNRKSSSLKTGPEVWRLRSEVRDYGMQGSMEMLKSWGFSHIKAAEKMFNT